MKTPLPSMTALKLQEERAQVQQALRAASEQVGHWTFRKAQAISRTARNDAGARLLAWQSTRRAHMATLLTLGGKAVA